MTSTWMLLKQRRGKGGAVVTLLYHVRVLVLLPDQQRGVLWWLLLRLRCQGDHLQPWLLADGRTRGGYLWQECTQKVCIISMCEYCVAMAIKISISTGAVS